jgi:hypothetical protein
MKVTIYNGTHDKILNMPGTVTDEEWKEKQLVTENRFANRCVSDVCRKEDVWVKR